jgi:hypothetical protein
MSRLPFELSVAKPCQEQWSAMTGTSSARYCGACNKTVHNLAAMTPRQISRLVRNSGGSFCARVTLTEGGKLKTGESPRSIYPAAAILASALLASPQMPAQSIESHTSSISGKVTDGTGEAATNATVYVQHNGNRFGSVRTDAMGRYEINAPAGDYQLFISSPGFLQSDIHVGISQSAHEVPPVVLQVGELLGEVVVTSDRGGVQVDRNESGTGFLPERRPWSRRVASRTRRLLHLSS